MEIFESPLFSGLDMSDRAFLSDRITSQCFSKGTELFERGQPADVLYILKSGLLKMSQERKGSAKEEIDCLIEPGDQFCLSPLIQGQDHHMTAVALDQCEVFALQRKDVLDFIDQSHTFARRVIHVLSKMECQLCEEVCDLSLGTTKERLAKYLVDQFEKQESPETFPLPLNQSDLAAYLGTVRETISRDMNAFKKAQLIEVNQKRVRILDVDGLKQMANRD